MKSKVTRSCPTDTTPWTIQSWDPPGQNAGVGSLSLLQGVFPTQGLNPGIPQCRRILHQLSHWGSPGMLEWVASPFSSRSSRPRNAGVGSLSLLQGVFLTQELNRGLLHCRRILYQPSHQGSPNNHSYGFKSVS